MIAVAAALVMFFTPVGLVMRLLTAGCVGIALFYSRRIGFLVVVFGAPYLILRLLRGYRKD
jgi:hypothetical protein